LGRGQSHPHRGRGAFLTEVILTALFVFVILGVTSETANAATAGVVIGLTLTVVHLIGIPITGTSVNPARSLGPALIVGGTALHQVWLFIVAPLVGGRWPPVPISCLFATTTKLAPEGGHEPPSHRPPPGPWHGRGIRRSAEDSHGS